MPLFSGFVWVVEFGVGGPHRLDAQLVVLSKPPGLRLLVPERRGQIPRLERGERTLLDEGPGDRCRPLGPQGEVTRRVRLVEEVVHLLGDDVGRGTEAFEHRQVLEQRSHGQAVPVLFGDRRERGDGGGPASRLGWERAVQELGVGGPFKDAMSEPGDWRIGATAFGEMLPSHANQVTMDPAKTDKWGLPVLAFDCEIGENERIVIHRVA